DIVAVIGPGKSEQVVEAARRFTPTEVVMVTPAATAGEIFRTYGDDDYVWRTLESDIAQTEIMILSALAADAEKVALLTNFSLYGDTFFDWFGFFAAEVGYGIDDVVVDRYGQDGDSSPDACAQPVNGILAGAPDILFAVPENDDQIVCMVNTVAAYNELNEPDVKLYFSSEGYRSELLTTLGDNAEGVEGVTLSAAPESGFDIEYKYRYGVDELPPYAANIYDAMLLVGYGLEHSGGKGGPDLAASLKEVVSYRGEPVGWDQDGVKDALVAIRENRRPNLTGATGTLTFEDELYTDLKESSYGQWRFENGRMVFSTYYSTGNNSIRSRSSTSILEARATSGAQQDITLGTYDPGVTQDDLWVFIVSVSKGWENYRHESDALRQYQMFKERGIADDRIILALQDDLADNEINTEAGVIRNEVDGPNLYSEIEIDYRLGDVSLEMIQAVLSGVPTEQFPTVIEAISSSNIYVYMVGHGGPAGVAVGAGNEADAFLLGEGAGVEVLSPELMLDSLCNMQDRSIFRRMLVVIEACFSGVMGAILDSGCGNDEEVVPLAIEVNEELAGDSCVSGGQRVDIGPDADESGAPDTVEASYFACDDETGEGMIAITPEVAGDNCSDGGWRVDIGTDLDSSGWLSVVTESSQTIYVCDDPGVKQLNGVLMLTAANASENSISYEYDETIDVWLADQFSAKLADAISSDDSYSLYELYNEVYLNVSGSHVSMYNSQYFGDVRAVMLEEFLRKED
ncbi:MAG: ABC transporter substrate-binding protein, partial [Deltaproteobacteria bacterium]|nr:ABC transporter substrate-binding protein [Deltaproteobacteria bacterium]